MRKLIAVAIAALAFYIPVKSAAGVNSTPQPVVTTAVVTSTTIPKPLVAPAIMKLWNRVAICETGGNWQMHGWKYSGGLGFRNDVWLEYGGGQYAPHAGLATPEEQVLIARAIQARANVPDFVPDQDGRCRGW